MNGTRHTVLFVGLLPPEQAGGAVMNAQLLQGLAGLGYRIEAVAPLTPDFPWQRRYAGDPDIPVARVRVPGLLMFLPAQRIAENFAAYADILTGALPPLIERLEPALILAGDEVAGSAVPDLAARYAVPALAVMHGPALAMHDLDYPQDAAHQVLPALRRLDRLITVSAAIGEGLRRHGFERIEAIANAVDTRRFRPRPAEKRFRRRLGIGADDVLVLHASNLRPIKRPLDIVESAALALRREPRLHYLIAGEDPLRDEMIGTAEAHGIRDRFTFVGWRPFAAMPRYYAAADIVVMTSAAEAAPLAYLEAQASARVLLSSDIPAARQMIVDGETGILFPTGDIPALAEATESLARDASLRAAIGRRARDWVAENRGFDACVAAYAETIDRMIAKRRADPSAADRISTAPAPAVIAAAGPEGEIG